MPTKTATFDSIYKSDYTVVEERRGNDVRLYPTTEQLPVILKAINLEFKSPMPARIARVDKRGNVVDKIILRMYGQLFCNFFNGSRLDQLQFYPIFDKDLVSRLGVVQKVTEHTEKGALHHFKFYTGPDFYQEIYLSGRRLMFTDHAIEQFLDRTPQTLGKNLSDFIQICFSETYIALDCGPGPAFVFFAPDNSVIAFPFEDTGTEFIVLSCLHTEFIHTLRRSLPIHHLHLSYDQNFTPPTTCTQNYRERMERTVECWEKKFRSKKPACSHDAQPKRRWRDVAYRLDDVVKEEFGHGSKLQFCDGVIGPCVRPIRPSEKEDIYNELEDCQRISPNHDWKSILARRDGTGYALTKSKISLPYQWNLSNPVIEAGQAALADAQTGTGRLNRPEDESTPCQPGGEGPGIIL